METSELKSEPDSELVIRFQENRDERAFSELYNRYYPKILQYSQHVLKGQEDAYDVAQDVFLRAMEKLPSLKNPVTFPAWLFSISRNICIDRCKHLAAIRTEPDDCSQMVSRAAEEHPEEEYQELEHQIDRVFQVLEGLNTESREILKMKYLDNYSIVQLQEYFHIGESAVKMRLARARSRVCMLCGKKGSMAL
jgi:RNA polymerase sigma factor (sigma-70 family)